MGGTVPSEINLKFNRKMQWIQDRSDSRKISIVSIKLLAPRVSPTSFPTTATPLLFLPTH